ncbi:hypothetical protein [Streptomyces ipomoeae]|uniref:hypothetical protein n=1 Tax=Streptomyces ipomoeae TaxID=103232 RepID=UPI00114676C4|nr:hypothetical protein [Streptomyces ipomoeae]TQE33095.1 hypothetical protein Sipo7851_21575 [Streptomyces ipomoeae]
MSRHTAAELAVDPGAGLPVPTPEEIGELVAYLRLRLTEAGAEQAQAETPATRALVRAVSGFLTSRIGFAHGLAAGAGDGNSPVLHETVAPLYELAAQFPDCPLHWRRRADEWMSGGTR